MKFYALSNCDTCRKAQKHLDAAKRGYEFIPIRDQPPTFAELKSMLRIYDGQVGKLFNTSGQEYRKLKLGEKLKSMEAEAALKLLAKNGMLVKRPFVLAGNTGAVGFKIDEWKLKGLR